MNAPLLWIFTPIIAGGLLAFVNNNRISTNISGLTAALLALIAFFIPIDKALLLGAFSFKLSSSMQLFGRNFIITSNDAHFLTILYGITALWIFGSAVVGKARRLSSLGLSFIALLVASIAVEPFLYAALTIEIAVLIAIPMLASTNNPPGRGTIRFVIFQTLAMPFILFSGWLLAGVEASPSDLALTSQAMLMLSLGLAFLLAIFPLYSWMPLLAEETSPYIFGFILWALPTVTTIFVLGFLDRYSWLRNSTQFTEILYISGILMVVTGGLWAAFQSNLARIMAYASIVETGLSLLAIGLIPNQSTNIVFMLIIPRALSIATWSFSLSMLKEKYGDLTHSSMQGSARNFPLASAGVILANFSAAGLPLLAGFPPRLALWEGLAQSSLFSTFWLGLGLFGLMISAIRTLAIMVITEEGIPWKWRESLNQLILLGLSIILLFFMGIFPQAIFYPLLSALPGMFIHLGQ